MTKGFFLLAKGAPNYSIVGKIENVVKVGRRVNSRKLFKIYDSEAKTPENYSKFANCRVRFPHKKLDLKFQMFIDARMHR
jgi:hypothetical protein